MSQAVTKEEVVAFLGEKASNADGSALQFRLLADRNDGQQREWYLSCSEMCADDSAMFKAAIAMLPSDGQ